MFSEKLMSLARKIPDYEPKKPNQNILFYLDTNYKDYYKAMNILDELNIKYVPVRLHERMVDKKFLSMLLEFTSNGFDDIIRLNSFESLFPELDYQDVSYSDMLNYIELNYLDLLKSFIFLGKDGKIVSKATEKSFYRYEEKE